MQLGRNHHMRFDTYKYVKDLMHKGAKESLAESIVQIVSDSRELDISKLATKDQVENVKLVLSQELEKVKLIFRQALENVKLKVEHVEEVLTSLEKRFIRLEEKVDTNLRWLIGIGATAIGLIMGNIGLSINVVMKIH